MTTMLNPLTDKECNDIDCVLQNVPSLMETAKAMQECGMDCAAEIEQLEKQQQWAAQVKKKFNPLAE